ncbi:MAG: hypothetical protein AB2L14_34715 [Candidatus Xenobiia bacterium LiM19]
MKTTEYYRKVTKIKHPEIKDEYCMRALQNSDYCEEQKRDGRWRYYKYIPELGANIRVITLSDGETVHNAFLDRNFNI